MRLLLSLSGTWSTRSGLVRPFESGGPWPDSTVSTFWPGLSVAPIAAASASALPVLFEPSPLAPPPVSLVAAVLAVLGVLALLPLVSGVPAVLPTGWGLFRVAARAGAGASGSSPPPSWPAHARKRVQPCGWRCMKGVSPAPQVGVRGLGPVP